jgi:hypothetical protein
MKNDTLPDNNLLYYIIIIVTLMGTFDIIREIKENSGDLFAENFMKKIILWTMIYLRTNSIFYSSIISTSIVLLLPRIFFGKKSRPGKK